METALEIAALCVLVSLMAVLIKKGSPESSMLLVLTAAVTVFLFLTSYFTEILDFLQELSEKTGVRQELFVPLYKTMGIALVVKLGGSLCKDAGESALASVIETAGSVCAVLVALPLLRTVLSMLLEMMNG